MILKCILADGRHPIGYVAISNLFWNIYNLCVGINLCHFNVTIVFDPIMDAILGKLNTWDYIS